MSLDIGHIEFFPNAQDQEVYCGEINYSDALTGQIWLVPVQSKRDDSKSPDFDVKIRRTRGGEAVNVGKAWRKKFNDAKRKDFFHSIQIQHPHFVPEPLSIAAFPDDDQPKDTPADMPVQFGLKWGRKRGGAAPMDPAPDQGFSDEIPY